MTHHSSPLRRSLLLIMGAMLTIQIDSTPLDAAPRPLARGSFAFHYASRLHAAELNWLKRFGLVVSGDILPPHQIQMLHKAGGRLFFYRWLTGLYLDPEGKASPHSWESVVSAHRSRWLLNPTRPDSGPDGTGRAYYYDPSDPQLEKAWVRWITGTLTASGYDGVFFDLVGSASIPEPLWKVYKERHPHSSYDHALGKLLRSLKRARPHVRIFTNQGYRIPDTYLPLADLDLSESLMTSYSGGEVSTILVQGEGLVEKRETFYRPWEELKRIVDAIENDRKRYNPLLKILHLNYVNPSYRSTAITETVGNTEYPVFQAVVDRAAIYYGYAAAKLWGHDSYSPSDGIPFARDQIYFVDLGKALGDSYEEQAGAVRRYYENGIVVLMPVNTTNTVDLGSPFIPSQTKGLWDCYAAKATEGFRVTIDPTVSGVSGRVYPAGRVYLYLR